ncbi:MAG: hypothetical protein H0Z35_10320 [Thermoanaerobacteraceae bacterium]|nr:hypothetical protein [Thermoanaerobacteraceae bacterium]
MKHFDFENRWQELTCFIPVYDGKYGNCSELWLDSGEKIKLPVKATNVLKSLARVFSLDLTTLKQKYRRRLQKGKLVPLPFHHDLVLVPFKVRQAVVKDDGVVGYAVYSRVVAFDAVSEGGYLSKLIFTNDLELKTYHTVTTVEDRLYQAELALKSYRQLYLDKGAGQVMPQLREGQVFYLITRCPGVEHVSVKPDRKIICQGNHK